MIGEFPAQIVTRKMFPFDDDMGYAGSDINFQVIKWTDIAWLYWNLLITVYI